MIRTLEEIIVNDNIRPYYNATPEINPTFFHSNVEFKYILMWNSQDVQIFGYSNNMYMNVFKEFMNV